MNLCVEDQRLGGALEWVGEGLGLESFLFPGGLEGSRSRWQK